ncbi:MAG: YihY/virulence factor BrkB family protein [Actinobacteria bacterium]|nr:YihY/virulence factor BrkB family protein [Actinomycetota bacterium]
MTKPDLTRRGAETTGPAAPARPTELGGRGWLAAAKRTLREYKKDALPDRAAALTYYGVLSIFPALLVLVSLLGLLSKSATQTLMTNLASTLPHTVHGIIQHAITHLQQGRGAAGALAAVGIVLGLWSASGYVAAFMRAANGVYDVQEGRPVWKTIPTRLGVTLALLILLIASTVIVVVTGGVARHVGQLLGLGPAAVTVWSIAKWPVLLLFVILMVAILYWGTPNARQRLRWVSPGAVVAVVGWLVASGLFAVYIANFSHYNKIYGSLASVIIFLIWLWITNLVILLGLEFNAELQRGRAIATGVPPGEEPYTELRDTRKVDR